MRRLFRKRRSWLILSLAVVVLVGAGCYWWWIRPLSANAASTPTTSTVAASLQTMEKTVAASGTLTPAVNETVEFAAAGTITAINVQVGDQVEAGQVLATIDTLSLQVSLSQAKADLETAKALLAQATKNSTGTESAKAQIASDQAQVDLDQQKYDQALAAMANAELKAPAAGQVTAISYEVGDQVSVGGGGAGGADGGSGSSTGITIVGTDAWQVSTSVDASGFANVKSGLQAEITLTDTSEKIFGIVESVDLVPTTTNGVAQYPVSIKVTGTPEGLHDGMSGDVAIVYERRTDVLAVPSGAITMSNGQAVVDKVDADGNVSRTAVTIGEVSGGYTEITEGLAEGDEVQITIVPQVRNENSSGSNGSGTQRMELPGGGVIEFRDDGGGMPPAGPMTGGGNGG